MEVCATEYMCQAYRADTDFQQGFEEELLYVDYILLMCALPYVTLHVSVGVLNLFEVSKKNCCVRTTFISIRRNTKDCARL